MSSLSTTAVLGPGPRTGLRGRLKLVVHQIRYEQLSFWRNPQSVSFTFALPVMVIVIFGAVFGGEQQDSFFYGLSGMQYFTPTVAALSVLGACYGQLAVTLSIRRQNGILKRLHATPVSAWTYFLGLLAHCVAVSVIDVVLVIGTGALYGVALPTHWAAIVVTLLLGVASFCALGVAVSSLISNSEAASSVVQFIQFPLLFISGNYFPIHSGLLNSIAGLLPMRPFNQALLGPFAQHTGFQWHQLGVLLAWGTIGTLIAVRRFRWDPRPE
ncbi:ABC-2 type transport system permease protein [Streptacidiphilus sp. MAP12-16]|uniref:ABC transporter permease n=1 Tax=Streptacidiphilus sp. MAP12-16 TaxID=3156300 RepID=UPI003512BA10